MELGGFDKLVADKGWKVGEEALADVADGLRTAAESVPGAALMHLGGDDFAAVVMEQAAPTLTDALRTTAGARARNHGLTVEVAAVPTSGAKTTEDVARAVGRARVKRPPR